MPVADDKLDPVAVRVLLGVIDGVLLARSVRPPDQDLNVIEDGLLDLALSRVVVDVEPAVKALILRAAERGPRNAVSALNAAAAEFGPFLVTFVGAFVGVMDRLVKQVDAAGVRGGGLLEALAVELSGGAIDGR